MFIGVYGYVKKWAFCSVVYCANDYKLNMLMIRFIFVGVFNLKIQYYVIDEAI